MEPAGHIKVFAPRSMRLGLFGCLMNSIAKQFRIDAENHELMGAQLAAFSRQGPLLYFILSVNSVAFGFTHLGVAPTSLTVAFPGVLVGACAIRCLIWLRRRDRVVEPK